VVSLIPSSQIPVQFGTTAFFHIGISSFDNLKKAIGLAK
jgi:hypothetical protein